ncbi:hypothetical protein SAMN04487901_12039 [Prevotella communis]|uniref:Uncharacterized protein n=1 Tax=Prevotella communis TaxID=2913614 RepID=A0A1G8AQZ2_9BACT|nr:hypothetical protein SAMN04487901_12039 [Prevotella communis]
MVSNCYFCGKDTKKNYNRCFISVLFINFASKRHVYVNEEYQKFLYNSTY